MKSKLFFLAVFAFLILFSTWNFVSTPIVSADPTETTDPWWHEDWPYRVQIIDADTDFASVNLDFTALFDELGLPLALLNLDSLRVIPYRDGTPGIPIPHQETYSTQFIATNTLNKDPNISHPYWYEEESTTLTLDETPIPDGSRYIHAHIDITEISNEKTGFLYFFNDVEHVNWSDFETLMYDVWPEVNQSAIDQSPDLFFFNLETPENHPCAEINGPALAMNQWNTGIISLNPYNNCDTSILSDIRELKFYVRVNRDGASYGNFDEGDELHLWLNNFRLVDQDGPGEIIWETEAEVDTYYIYFDTINHQGHPPPELVDLPEPTTSATHGVPQAGGYFHLVSGTQTEGLHIWQAPVVEKILTTNKAPIIAKPLVLQAARGEFVPFQLITNSATEQSLPIIISDLQNHSENAVISEDQVHLFRVDYINITKISDYYGRIVLWPDPLYPIMMGDEVPLQPGINQPLWFRIKVPPTAQPGLYEGSITIGTAIIPLTLEVWPFTLPAYNLLETRVGFDWDAVNQAYQGDYDGIPPDCQSQFSSAIAKTLSDYRLTTVPPEQPGFTENDLRYTLTSYEINQAQTRQLLEGNRVWWEFSPYDHPPLPNPAVIDRPGSDARILPWLAWLDRVDGLYYPHANNWDNDPWHHPYSEYASNGHGYFFYPPNDDMIGSDPCDPVSNRLIPSIRLELLREGLEDYALLYLLNQGKPIINQPNVSDSMASNFIASRTSFNRIPTTLDTVRQQIASQIPPFYLPVYYLPLILR